MVVRPVVAAAPAASVLAARWARWPPWVQVLVVFAATRLFALVLVDRTARFQPASPWSGAEPGYLGMVSMWDGGWYREIAESGYPDVLPRGVAGDVQQNPWAFSPLFPLLARYVGGTLGVGWPVAASLVSLTCAGLAVVLLRSLVEAVSGRRAAFWCAALLCCAPAAPVLQLAYSESTALLLLVAVLWCLQRRRYLLGVVPMLLLGLARPVAAPLTAVVALHLLRRLREHDRPRGTRLLDLVVLLAAGAVATVAWPLVAAAATGDAGAYTGTMSAWRAGDPVTPVLPWLRWTGYLLGPWAGPAALLVLAAAVAFWLRSRPGRVVAGDLRAWVGCYLLYLLAVLDPGTSLVRYLLLAFPLGAVVAAASPSRAYRVAVAAASLAGQVVWVVWLWRFLPPYDWPP